MTLRLKCHPGIGPRVEGEALVADDDFSARYDLDRLAGTFSRPGHKLAGLSYVDRVLVRTRQGRVASAWMLREMAERGLAPRAILFNAANTILAQGAAFAGMALCDRFEDGDITRLIATGDRVIVDPPAGLVTVVGKAADFAA